MDDKTAPGDLALVQELVNTLDVESGRDSLSTPGGLRAFAERHSVPLADEDLPAVITVREQLRALLLAHSGIDVPAGPLTEINGALDAAPLVLRVDYTGGGRLAPAPGLTGLPALTALVAVAAATGLDTGRWQRLKVCVDLSCAWAYYDRSPAGRRRWCSMQVCGARNKMRSYRARRRES